MMRYFCMMCWLFEPLVRGWLAQAHGERMHHAMCSAASSNVQQEKWLLHCV